MIRLCIVVVDGVEQWDLIDTCLDLGRQGFNCRVYTDELYMIVGDEEDIVEGMFTDEDIDSILEVERTQAYDEYGNYTLTVPSGHRVRLYQ